MENIVRLHLESSCGESKSMGIREVAKMASVSTATVSRLITGAAKVSPNTAARVSHAMQVLNFHPNEAARILAFQKKLKRGDTELRRNESSMV